MSRNAVALNLFPGVCGILSRATVERVLKCMPTPCAIFDCGSPIAHLLGIQPVLKIQTTPTSLRGPKPCPVTPVAVVACPQPRTKTLDLRPWLSVPAGTLASAVGLRGPVRGSLGSFGYSTVGQSLIRPLAARGIASMHSIHVMHPALAAYLWIPLKRLKSIVRRAGIHGQDSSECLHCL